MHLVRHVARNRPRLPRPELAGLLADAKLQRARQAHPELLGLVLVLGNNAPGIELEHSKRGPLAVDDATVHTVPDAPQVE